MLVDGISIVINGVPNSLSAMVVEDLLARGYAVAYLSTAATLQPYTRVFAERRVELLDTIDDSGAIGDEALRKYVVNLNHVRSAMGKRFTTIHVGSQQEYMHCLRALTRRLMKHTALRIESDKNQKQFHPLMFLGADVPPFFAKSHSSTGIELDQTPDYVQSLLQDWSQLPLTTETKEAPSSSMIFFATLTCQTMDDAKEKVDAFLGSHPKVTGVATVVTRNSDVVYIDRSREVHHVIAQKDGNDGDDVDRKLSAYVAKAHDSICSTT